MKKLLIVTLVIAFTISACQASPSLTPLAGNITETAVPATAQPTAIQPTAIQPVPIQPRIPGEHDGVIAFYSDRDGNPEIYTLHADGSGLARLTDDPAFDDSPAISPDGTRIAFLTARHDPNPQFPNLKYELYVMDIDGGNPQRLTTTETAEDHPAWSPDGSRIIFDADYDADGFYEIYTIQPDGSNLTRLTSNAANDQFADWSPDGTQIAFSSERNGNWDIFVMNVDGSDQRPLTDSADWELFPAWSPDGTQIAFNGLVPRSRNTDIFVMNADGSNIRQLTDTPRFDENPAWSPDGSQIVFQTERDGNFEIHIMNADGSDPHPLAENAYENFWPSWSISPAQKLAFEMSAQQFTATLKPSKPTITPTSTRIPTATSVPGTLVTFLTEDGIQLDGTLYGSGDIAVIMAHQGTYGATQATWQPLIPALIKEDFTGMPFDFRGFGQSGGPGRIKRLDDDIRAAAKYLRSQNYDRIVCAGSCMGGTACLRAAIDGEPFIGLIILASPFDASGGLVVNLEELEQLTQPKLFITGNQDVYGIAWDIKRMYEFSTEPRTLLTFEQSAHGTDLFQTAAREELIDAILNFLISLR